jgi:AcrR family transcriptional regulator
MSAPAFALDRRQRRRLETIEEVLDVALEVMAEQGVAGLTLGEIARRMGIRPPSLYVYFPSKHALYDALFARGSRLFLEATRDAQDFLRNDGDTLDSALLASARAMVSWSMANPQYSQLLFWRPVPGFEPSAEAYAPAVALMELGLARFTELQQRGRVRDDVPAADILRDWTILTAGVVSQQLSNAPDEPFATGAFASRLPTVVSMFAQHYAPSPPPARQRKARHAEPS